jgi:glutamine cyclotransferase
MTNDGKQLIMSNGSSNLYFRDPETFAVTKTVAVSNNYGPLGSINELEYVDGFVYANVWTTFKIVKIDLASGNVVGEANLDDLLPKYAPEILNEPVDKGLNGIAYDSIGKRFFITGKYYPKIFEVKFN